MRKICLAILIITVLLPIPLLADTIVLKSGKKIECKILEKTDKDIKIDFYGVPITYHIDEIADIDGEETAHPKLVKTFDSDETKAEHIEEVRVKNGAFRISLPIGWHRKHDEKLAETGSALFLKEEVDTKPNIFAINVTDIGIGNNPAYNTVSYQTAYLDKFKKEVYGGVKAESTELFGVPALIVYDQNKDKTIRIKHYYFLKDCKLYEISFLSADKYFDVYWPEIEKTISSIEFIK